MFGDDFDLFGSLARTIGPALQGFERGQVLRTQWQEASKNRAIQEREVAVEEKQLEQQGEQFNANQRLAFIDRFAEADPGERGRLLDIVDPKLLASVGLGGMERGALVNLSPEETASRRKLIAEAGVAESTEKVAAEEARVAPR